jgi:hypothetical protein
MPSIVALDNYSHKELEASVVFWVPFLSTQKWNGTFDSLKKNIHNPSSAMIIK